MMDTCLKEKDGKTEVLCGKENATLEESLAAACQLKDRLAQAERERDAAVNDLRDNYEPCNVCKKKNICEQYCPKNGYDCVSCLDTERCIFYNCTKDNDLWEWRGVCTENTKEAP